MYAILKGMGFSGVHIGGHNIKYEQVDAIVEIGESLTSQWKDLVQYFDYPIEGGFYYYEKDPETGLNREAPVKLEDQLPDVKIGCSYAFSRFFHRFMYKPGKNLYGFMKGLCGKIQGNNNGRAFSQNGAPDQRLCFLIAETAGTAPSLTSPISARCRNARKTSATAPAVEATKAGVKSTRERGLAFMSAPMPG